MSDGKSAITVRMDASSKEEVVRAAKAAGKSTNAYVLSKLFGDQPPRYEKRLARLEEQVAELLLEKDPPF